MRDLVIRPMKAEDISALCAAEGGETPDNRACYERYLTWQEQDRDCAFLLAFEEGRLVGHLFVFYHDTPDGREDLDIPRLADLRVWEPFQRRGIAAALMKAGEQLAGLVCDRVFLTVRPDAPIRQAYARRGYRPFGEEADELVLVKRLND